MPPTPEQAGKASAAATSVLLCAALLAGCDGSGEGSRGSAPTPADPLSLQLTVEGDGQVSSSPRTRDCFGACTLDFAAGTRPTLLAVPARGGRFAGWGGACADETTSVCTPAGSGSLRVTARFEPVPAEAADWYEGDLHTHSDHSSDGSLPRQTFDDRAPGNMPITDILRLAGNLGADFLPITDHRTYDQHYDPQWTSDTVLLIPGEEANGRPHATVHGAVDMIDQNAALEGAPGSRVVQESIWLAHSQGAVWVSAHPDRDSVDSDGDPLSRADAVGVDLVEIWNRAENPEAEIDYAENRWNAGWRFGVAGASDNHFKELWALGGTPLRPATATLAPVLNERAVLDSLRSGSTIVYSNGPTTPRVKLEADFDGDGVFEAVAGQERLVPGGTAGRLRARVEGGLGSRLLIFAAPGRSAGPIASIALAGAPGGDEHEIEVVTPEDPGWYRAELRSIGLAEPASLLTGVLLGPYNLENLFQELLAQLRAATSPIFVSAAPVAPVGDFLPPADAGQDDGAEYALGAPGEFAGFPDAAVDAGVLHVVGEVHDAQATRVQYLARSADGRWLPPLTLSDSNSARFPKVAARDGRIVVAWQDERAGQIPRRPAVWLRVSDDGGLSFGPEIAVRGTEGRAMHPELALAADGAAHLVWQEITAGAPFDVWYTTLDADGVVAEAVNLSRAGKDIDPGSPLDARSARYPASVWPAIALDAAGPVVAWQDNRFDLDPLWTGGAGYGEGTSPDDWQIAVLRPGLDAAPVFLGDSDAADRHPDVIIDGAGRTHVVWDSKALLAAGANLRILAAVRAPTAADFSSAQAVAETPAASARRPRLGLDGQGSARLNWFDSRSADWRWRVMHAAYDGAQWGAGSLLDGPGVNTWPVPAGPFTVFASTRHAQRLQRDRTQQVFAIAGASPVARAATPLTRRLAPMPPEHADPDDCAHPIPGPIPATSGVHTR